MLPGITLIRGQPEQNTMSNMMEPTKNTKLYRRHRSEVDSKVLHYMTRLAMFISLKVYGPIH